MCILLPSVYLRHCNASITQHIMQSHSSKVKHSSSTSRSSDTILQDHKAPNNAPDQKHRQKARRDVRNPPTMFSDPLDSSSSDTRSFDDDDMYGSDSGVETISLKHDLKEKARDNKETMVCTCPTMYIRAILHLRQEDSLIPTFARMEVIMNDIAIMVNALCEAEGIDATSIPSDAQDQSSSLPLPHFASDMPSYLEGSDHGKGG